MTQPTEVLASGVCVLTAAVAVIGARLVWHPTQPTVQPRALQDPGVWLACHSLTCAHTTTLHDPTPVGGLACRNCHTVTHPEATSG